MLAHVVINYSNHSHPCSVFKGDCRHAVIGLCLIDRPISNTCSDNMGGFSVCPQLVQMGSLRLRVQHIKRRLQSNAELLASPRLATVRLIDINRGHSFGSRHCMLVCIYMCFCVVMKHQVIILTV